MLSGNGWHSTCDYKCGKLDHAAVCGAVGLIFAILAMIWFEPFVIIATALAGGFGAGMMIYDLAGLKNCDFHVDHFDCDYILSES